MTDVTQSVDTPEAEVSVETPTVSIEKSIADVVVDEVKGFNKGIAQDVKALDAKLDANLESIKSAMPTTDGLISAEDAATMADAKVEAAVKALEVKMAAPSLIASKEVSNPMEFTKQADGKSGFNVDNFVKAVDTNSNIAGAGVEGVMPTYTLAQVDVFADKATVQLVNSGSIKLPILSGINFAVEATNNASRTKGGTLTSTTVVIDRRVAQAEFAMPVLEDLPGLDTMVAGLITQQYGVSSATDARTVLNAGTFSNTNSGVAAALPTATNINGIMNSIVASVDPAYLERAEWMMSRAAYSIVQQSNTSGVLQFNPELRQMMYLGYPITVTSHLDAGTSAGDKPVYFGDFSQGLFLGARRDLEIRRFEESTPGLLTYFASGRTKYAVWNAPALASMTIAA